MSPFHLARQRAGKTLRKLGFGPKRPKTAADPEPSAGSAGAKLPLGILLGAIGVLVSAAGIGITAALMLPEDPASLSVAGVSFQVPAGWSAIDEPPSAVTGVVGIIPRPLAVAPGGHSGRGMAIVGLVPGALGRHLLARSVMAGMRGSPALTIMDLGPRYVGTRDDIRLSGIASPLRVYSIPTSKTTVSVVCVESPGPEAQGTLEACDRMSTTLEIAAASDGSAYEAVAGSGYYATLQKIVKKYSDTREFLRERLVRVGVWWHQASVAEELAAAAQTACAAFAPLHDAVVPAEQKKLERALKAATGAYTVLSRAIVTGNAGAYAVASRDIHRTDDEVTLALREIALL